MANIKVNDLAKLNLSGTELFDDSESFITELNDENEQLDIVGGYCFLTNLNEQPVYTIPAFTDFPLCRHQNN